MLLNLLDLTLTKLGPNCCRGRPGDYNVVFPSLKVHMPMWISFWNWCLPSWWEEESFVPQELAMYSIP